MREVNQRLRAMSTMTDEQINQMLHIERSILMRPVGCIPHRFADRAVRAEAERMRFHELHEQEKQVKDTLPQQHINLAQLQLRRQREEGLSK